mmetsp:Transcript_45307/g.72416  ORF Transcript_45307/g.72416 Transcript_45307/m.72416 type:complete len:256 (-) Transcript_45307:389-1156(-)|eukprot:CAMPEP_0197022450 /NCGR_PEP_ID=MMETSP1384-20130603/3327_1 /TAXON_ID=29189 /ORGANISM="Ammonia sp." /LENGTH=255 /DNA_ID=CAMNT_0042450497 /DNA_START=129 /DNA_END=896 /DNA_ORIENTATION=+
MDDPEKQPLESGSENEEDEAEQIQISIKKLDGDTFYVTISTTATVLGLKTIIHDQQQVETSLQRLIYRAQELKDDFPLSQYGIQNGSTLHLVVRRPQQQNQVRVGMPDDGLMVDPYARFSAMDAEAMIDVMSVVRLCRFVRIFALIDAVFLLIYGLQAFYFIILAVLAIAGYWGSKNLDRKYLLMYCLCLALEIAVRCYMIYIDQTNIINIILLVLMILIDLFVLRCVYKLYRAIPLLGPEQRDRVLILNRVGLI